MSIAGRFFRENPFESALVVITIAGLSLRLHGLWTESFTADELDTVFRVKHSPDLGRLLGFWVMHDGHPPFTHLFEYFWTKIFGFSEGAIRFPFALMTSAAIWFAGRTAKMWFSSGAGIAVAAGVAFLQFPLMYSQLARPYAPGLFFSMMFIFYWTKYFFAEKKNRSDIIWFVVAGAGAVYSHYFSLFLAGIIGVTGLFFLNKQNWKKYLVACGMIVLLFLPYLKLFFFQLNAGGVGGPGGWLGKPTPDFFYQHLWFIFDESRPVLIGTLTMVLFSFILFRVKPNRFTLLSLIFFAVPLLTGYFYSRIGNPVLQNSVLLFSFPFLLMLLFSGIPPIEKGRLEAFFPAAFSFAALLYVMVYKPFHLTDHFGRLREIAQATIDELDEAGNENVTCSFNMDYPFFMEYYWERLGTAPKQVITYRNVEDSLVDFRKKVEESKGKYFVYGWSTTIHPQEVMEIIREFYPELIKREFYFNSAVYVFSRGIDALDDEDWSSEYNAEHLALFPNSKNNWSFPGEVLVDFKDSIVPLKIDSLRDSTLRKLKVNPYSFELDLNPDEPYNYEVSRTYCVRIDSAVKFGPTLKVKLGDIAKNPDNIALLDAFIELENADAVGQLVMQVNRKDSILYYMARATTSQLIEPGKYQHVYFGFQLPADLQKDDEMLFYIYSFNGIPIRVRSLTARVLEGQPGVYGPRPDFE